jgi:peptide/nickel transport system substrate-binding protein
MLSLSKHALRRSLPAPEPLVRFLQLFRLVLVSIVTPTPEIIMRRSILRVAAVAAALVLSTPLSAKELVIGLAADLTGVDPHWHNHGQNSSNATHVFDTLLALDAKGTLIPGLATAWKPLGPTRHELKLRQGVKFHDGAPFTARDVVASFERVIKGIPNTPGAFTTFTAGITAIRAVGDDTVVFETEGPMPLIYKNISRIFIISEKQAAAPTEDYTTGKAMIGTGPYKFVRWTPGVSLEYVRNDASWRGQEPWDKVTFKIMKNDSSRLAALLAGDVDIISGVPTNDIERVEKNPAIKLWSGPTSRFTMFVPGFAQGPDSEHFSAKDGSPLKENPFRNAKVRQALNLAIDRDVIVQRVNQGQAVRARQFLPEGMTGYIPGYDASVFDPKKAKQLMVEAGYPDGFRVNIHTSNDRIVNAVKTIQTVAQMWTRHLAMDVKVETMPHAVFSKRRGKRELPMYMSSWGNGILDPMGVINPLLMTFDKAKGNGASNRSGYSNPELDKLGELAAVEVDPEKYEELCRKALKIGMDDLAMMPVVFWVFTWGTKANLTYIPRLDQATQAMAVREKK